MFGVDGLKTGGGGGGTGFTNCVCACSIAKHATNTAVHPATKHFASIIRSNLLVCFAISFEPMFPCCGELTTADQPRSSLRRDISQCLMNAAKVVKHLVQRDPVCYSRFHRHSMDEFEAIGSAAISVQRPSCGRVQPERPSAVRTNGWRRTLTRCHSLFGKLLHRLRIFGKVSQSHAAQNVRRLGELNIVVANDLDAVAPRVPEVEERSRQRLNACLGQCSTDGILVVNHKAKVAPVVWRLTASLLKREELVAKVDEGHMLAFAAKLEVKYPSVERQRFLDVAHFKRDVIETHDARSFGFRHKTPLGKWLQPIR